MNILDKIEALKRAPANQHEIIYEFQRRYGLRWHEVVSLKLEDIITEEEVLFHGAKRGYDRFIYAPDLIFYIRRLSAGRKEGKFFTVSYQQHRRWLYQRNKFTRLPGRKYNIVSHLPRHIIATRRVRAEGEIDPSVSRSLGHKSNRTILYYLTQEVKKNE